jgi:hypothetical protein
MSEAATGSVPPASGVIVSAVDSPLGLSTESTELTAVVVAKASPERVILSLTGPATRANGQPGKLLRHETAHPDGPARGQQVVRSLRSQAVGHGEVAVEVAHVQTRRRGELVHDHPVLARSCRASAA